MWEIWSGTNLRAGPFQLFSDITARAAYMGGATIVNINKNERASRETLQSAVHENNASHAV